MSDAAHYRIALHAAPGDARSEQLQSVIADAVASLGADLVDVDFELGIDLGTPSVMVVLWSDTMDASAIETAVTEASRQGLVVLPVVNSTTNMPADLPDSLSRLNAIGWDDSGVDEIASVCLRELGIHEAHRGVFISHRRHDGLLTAEHLHDALVKTGWRPFVDRFHVAVGREVQNRIAEALEECAFLLLIETPLADASSWVEHEVLYALDRGMGIAIVTLPGAAPIPVASTLPRLHIPEEQVTTDGSQQVLTPDAIQDVLAFVERQHVAALVQRRRQLLVSVQASATGAGRACVAAPGWRLLVSGERGEELVGVSPHLPRIDDVYSLDDACTPGQGGVLVHAAHTLGGDRAKVLRWCLENRQLDLVPNNAIGARWRTA